MRKTLATLAVCALIAGAARPAEAWGYAAHRLIMRRAIELLPAELKPFFEQHRDTMIVRVTDPDEWRNVGWPEDPNHFVDYGLPEFGPYPFAGLPHDYDAALQKFGPAFLEHSGKLPWRAAEMWGFLRRAFADLSRNSQYTISNLELYAPVTAHYIQDSFQPFHATDNYDGYATGQGGIHARFERDLIERFESRLRLTPAPPVAITKPRDFVFDALLPSYQAVDLILKADKEALGSKDVYDDAYFETFFMKVQPILEKQLSGAISATAGAIIGAWQEAGRPVLRMQDARPLQRVRPPRP